MSENDNIQAASEGASGKAEESRMIFDRLAAMESKLSTFALPDALEDRVRKLTITLDQAQSQINTNLSAAEQSITAAESVAAKANEASAVAQTSKAAAVEARTAAESERDKIVQASVVTDSAKATAEAAKIAIEGEMVKAAEASAAANTERNNAIQAGVAVAEARKAAEAEKDETFKARAGAEAEKDKALEASSNTNAAMQSAKADQDKATQAAFYAEGERDKAVQSSTDAMKASKSADEFLATATVASAMAVEAKAKAEQDRQFIEQAKLAADVVIRELTELKKLAIQEHADAKKASESAKVEAKAAADAHNLSTTAGLAGAFNQKAITANHRIVFWGVALMLALSAVAVIGWFRYKDLVVLISGKPDVYSLGAEVVLAILGVSAPVWLGWVATKMISKNFVVAEDYAYKASIAKAYVGFREEAKGLDPLLEQRLFAAAITQLDANPVRFLDSNHPASPLQELLQQPFMQNVLEDQTVKQLLIDWFKAKFNTKLSVVNKAEAPT